MHKRQKYISKQHLTNSREQYTLEIEGGKEGWENSLFVGIAVEGSLLWLIAENRSQATLVREHK